VALLASCSPHPNVRQEANWRLQQIATLAPDSILTPASIQLLTDGSVRLADRRARRVWAFDSTGRFEAVIGREGAGPGEYREPYALASAGETLAVLDPRNARIGLFRRDGMWLGAWPAPPVTGGETIRLYRTGRAEFYAYMSRGRGRTPAYLRYRATGPADTLEFDSPLQPGIRCTGSDQGLRYFPAPFAARSLAIPGPGRTLLTAVTDRYALAQVGPTGDTLRLFRRAAEPLAISDTEWETATAEHREYRRQDPGGTCDRPGFTRPGRRPIFRTAFWDDAGSLWVERYTRAGFAFDVFAASGEWRGSVESPARDPGTEPSVVGDRIALAGFSAESLPVVRIFRLLR
jgi:hypothetical protein